MPKISNNSRQNPKDTLAKIINERGYEWLESLPRGIGAIKKGLDRDGLFVLFTDGNDFYWRLRYYDKKSETMTSPTDIVDTIMEGEIDNSGESIDYNSLISRMKDMKEDLRQQLEARANRERALEGVPTRASQPIREIFDELANSGIEDAERLAMLFRKQSNRQTVVAALQNARRQGQLVAKARDSLRSRKLREKRSFLPGRRIMKSNYRGSAGAGYGRFLRNNDCHHWV